MRFIKDKLNEKQLKEVGFGIIAALFLIIMAVPVIYYFFKAISQLSTLTSGYTPENFKEKKSRCCCRKKEKMVTAPSESVSHSKKEKKSTCGWTGRFARWQDQVLVRTFSTPNSKKTLPELLGMRLRDEYRKTDFPEIVFEAI
jgi:hypothetical protein